MGNNTGSDQPDFSYVNGAAVAWRASTFAAGVEVKDLGAANGRAMQLVRFPPGAIFPPHEHAGPEFVYIIEGELIQNGNRMGRGWASVASAGTVDGDVRSETGCIFLIVYAE